MDRRPDIFDTMYDSKQNTGDQASDEDFIKDHSSLKSDDEVVPKLRRTKSVLVGL